MQLNIHLYITMIIILHGNQWKEGNKMIYAIMETPLNKTLYFDVSNDMQEYIKKSFSPVNVVWIIDTEKPPKGKSYNEKKRALQTKAENYSGLMSYNYGLHCYCCIDNIADYFYKYGKKYGLLREFQAMRII